jgi:hypothetical protein
MTPRFILSRRDLGAFFCPQPGKKTGLSAPIFWLRQKDFRYNPWRAPQRRTANLIVI